MHDDVDESKSLNLGTSFGVSIQIW